MTTPMKRGMGLIIAITSNSVYRECEDEPYAIFSRCDVCLGMTLGITAGIIES